MSDLFSFFDTADLGVAGATFESPVGDSNNYAGLDQYGNIDPTSAYWSPTDNPNMPATQYNSITPSAPYLQLNSLGPPSTGSTAPNKVDLSSLGKLLGNIASNLIQPSAQGQYRLPLTNNVATAGNASSLLSNPIILIGGIVLLVLLLK